MTPSNRLLRIKMTKLRLSLLVRMHIKHKFYEKVVEKLLKKLLKSLLIFQIFQYKIRGLKYMEKAAPVFLVPNDLRFKSLRRKTRVQGLINASFVTRNSAPLRVSVDIPAKPIME